MIPVDDTLCSKKRSRPEYQFTANYSSNLDLVKTRLTLIKHAPHSNPPGRVYFRSINMILRSVRSGLSIFNAM